MYEGQTIICKSVIEENWLEYLAYVKKKAEEEMERQKKRMAALAEIEQTDRNRLQNAVDEKVVAGDHYYYDMSINGFWNWYIQNKV